MSERWILRPPIIFSLGDNVIIVYNVAMITAQGGMDIGPGYDNRGTVRHWTGLSESAVCRIANVTRATLVAWEGTHDGQIPGKYAGDRGEAERDRVVRRLADLYAAFLWIAGGYHWPRILNDVPLRAAVERMRSMELPPSEPLTSQLKVES